MGRASLTDSRLAIHKDHSPGGWRGLISIITIRVGEAGTGRTGILPKGPVKFKLQSSDPSTVSPSLHSLVHLLFPWGVSDHL